MRSRVANAAVSAGVSRAGARYAPRNSVVTMENMSKKSFLSREETAGYLPVQFKRFRIREFTNLEDIHREIEYGNNLMQIEDQKPAALFHFECMLLSLMETMNEKGLGIVFDEFSKSFCPGMQHLCILIEFNKRKGDVLGCLETLDTAIQLGMKDELAPAIEVLLHYFGTKETTRNYNHFEKVWKFIQVNGITYTPRMFRSIVNSLSRFGRLKQAEEVFEFITFSGMWIPDTQIFNSLIQGYTDKRDADNAMKWFRRLQNYSIYGIEPDSRTFFKILHAICLEIKPIVDGQPWNDAFEEILLEIADRDIPLEGLVTVTVLTGLVSNGSNGEIVFKLFEKLLSEVHPRKPNRKLKKMLDMKHALDNFVTYNLLFEVAVRMNDTSRFEQLASLMFERNVEPNWKTLLYYGAMYKHWSLDDEIAVRSCKKLFSAADFYRVNILLFPLGHLGKVAVEIFRGTMSNPGDIVNCIFSNVITIDGGPDEKSLIESSH